MKRVATMSQHPNSGIYCIDIYDQDAYGKEYVFAATVLTPGECHKIAQEYGVIKENLTILPLVCLNSMS